MTTPIRPLPPKAVALAYDHAEINRRTWQKKIQQCNDLDEYIRLQPIATQRSFNDLVIFACNIKQMAEQLTRQTQREAVKLTCRYLDNGGTPEELVPYLASEYPELTAARLHTLYKIAQSRLTLA